MIFSFDSDIAIRVGVNAAILYNNIEWWCLTHKANNDERYFHDGKWWMTNSRSAWVKLYPFFTDKSIRIALGKLVEEGLLIKANYNSNPLDRTAWYSTIETGIKNRENALAPNGQSTGPYRPMTHARNNIYNNIQDNNIIDNVLTNNVLTDKEKNTKNKFFVKKESAELNENSSTADATEYDQDIDQADFSATIWGQAIIKQFGLNNELLEKAIGAARCYCLSNDLPWNEANLKRYTLSELTLHRDQYVARSQYEVIYGGKRKYDYGGDIYPIPDDAPPRPDLATRWDEENKCWTKKPFFPLGE